MIRPSHVTATRDDSNSPWTLKQVLQWASEDFRKRNLPSPRLEAELLLADVLGTDRVGLVVQSSRPLNPDELEEYRAHIKRRREGEPVAYILGFREFYGKRYIVDQRVLVPRPETEILVEEALSRTAHRHLSGRALELGTGSGCIAVSFALQRPTWQITATDISSAALDVARKNALLHGAVWGMAFAQGDLFSAVPSSSRYELVVANPPYIPATEIESLQIDVRDFEPRLALDGGQDGLDFYRRLATEAPSYLVPGGVLAVEVGADQAPLVSKLLASQGFEDLRRTPDYAGHERVVSAKRGRTSAST